jgi:hypothetical protein
LTCSGKGTFGYTIVIAVFTFAAVAAFGLAGRDHGLAILGAVELRVLVLFHGVPPFFSN